MRQNTENFSITLPVEIAQLICEKVNTGIYASNSELIFEAMCNEIEEDKNHKIRLQQLRQDIREGLESGETSTWNPKEIKAEARKQKAISKSMPVEIYQIALSLRVDRNFKTPDALHVATAQFHHCQAF